MTEAVTGIVKAGEIDRRKPARDRFWPTAWQTGHGEQDEQDDTVQISDEARQRSSGKLRKTILEHLAEDDDTVSGT
ncbi:MAG: hypothetical protein AB7T17_10720 [Geobacter sp.]|jgi:hypothetical protein|uniref:hypothetical protein n=1 Tax=Trichlorobacter sp. TaxID=2911007 RepID=UPI002A3683FC|nr:hypothetical protein [Trichlorobacter sp.]MDY0383232.1 hypothetical protein [Trichlorobacter sp.]